MLDVFLAEGHDPKYIGTPLVIDTYMQRDWDSWINGLGGPSEQVLFESAGG